MCHEKNSIHVLELASKDRTLSCTFFTSSVQRRPQCKILLYPCCNLNFHRPNLGHQSTDVLDWQPIRQTLAPYQGIFVHNTVHPSFSKNRKGAWASWGAQSIPGKDQNAQKWAMNEGRNASYSFPHIDIVMYVKLTCPRHCQIS